ncbi:MAG: hypothetical protein MK171_09435 [Pirellulales bacterium]|nr:hypothetical protein [Pirellulales bacterium]
MTTIVLVTSMLTAVFGHKARDASLFGNMGALPLTMALFEDIIFLPAQLIRFAGRRGNFQAHPTERIAVVRASAK